MMVKKTHRGHIPRIAIGILALIIVTAAYTGVAGAQRGDICLGCDPKTQNATSLQASATSLQASHYGSSPFAPPQNNDHTFVVDKGPGLDTGCTFRSEGPLVFTIDVGRYPGNLDKLIENGLIEKTAELKMPAYDVDFDGGASGYNPERDRVYFNGHLVPTEFLTGENNVWKLNSFNIPIEWINFPSDPGEGNSITKATNTITIDIDTANSDEVWCTSIDWAWNWDFGDGTTSTKQSPIHQYTKDGTYTVTLKVSNANGGGLYESKTATVTVSPQKTPDADFDSNVSSGIAPLDVKFTDKSTNSPTDWVWNFGDGATSTDHNPVHTYKAGGTYKVTLTASNAFGSDSVADFITVDDVVKLAADFSANTAYAPLTVAFTDKSTGNPTKWACT